MNVTKDGFKDRQLHMEDYLQMVSAEQKEYAGVSVYQRITENNDIITDFWTDNLLELILRKDNLNKAYKKVKSNKGKGGTDGMQVDELLPYLKEKEGELFLKVNRAKTTVTHVSRIKYLGYAFYRNKGKCRLRVHPKSVRKMKDRLREITEKNKGCSNDYRRQKLAEYVRGWINYYRLADMKGLMTETDEWLRRRIRAIYWKQWKKVKTRYRNLRALKLEEWQVHQIANSRKGYWRTAQILRVALTNKIIAKLGYISMLDYYLKVS